MVSNATNLLPYPNLSSREEELIHQSQLSGRGHHEKEKKIEHPGKAHREDKRNESKKSNLFTSKPITFKSISKDNERAKIKFRQPNFLGRVEI